jgi:hypothetical protein
LLPIIVGLAYYSQHRRRRIGVRAARISTLGVGWARHSNNSLFGTQALKPRMPDINWGRLRTRFRTRYVIENGTCTTAASRLLPNQLTPD